MKHEKFPEVSDTECTREDGARAEITLLCDVRQGIRPWARVRLMDISQSGFRIAWFPGVDTKQALKIRIPGLEVLTADVRWRAQNSLGCEFAEPLYVAVFEHIVRQARAQFG